MAQDVAADAMSGPMMLEARAWRGAVRNLACQAVLLEIAWTLPAHAEAGRTYPYSLKSLARSLCHDDRFVRRKVDELVEIGAVLLEADGAGKSARIGIARADPGPKAVDKRGRAVDKSGKSADYASAPGGDHASAPANLGGDYASRRRGLIVRNTADYWSPHTSNKKKSERDRSGAPRSLARSALRNAPVRGAAPEAAQGEPDGAGLTYAERRDRAAFASARGLAFPCPGCGRWHKGAICQEVKA
jgi:hypothetical protein